MARVTGRSGKTIHVEFDKTVTDQVNVVHLFDAMLGKEAARTCEACGGIVPEDQEGRAVPRRARCACPVEPDDGPSAA